MEVEENEISEDLRVEEVLKGVENALKFPERENEVLRALEVAFGCLGVSRLTSQAARRKLFDYVCPAAEEFLVKKLQSSASLETNKCCESLDTCVAVIDYFNVVFNSVDLKVTLSFIESWLLSSIRMIYSCFQHCGKSEQLYGHRFTDLAISLSNLFKKCCTFIEKLINTFTENSLFDLSNNLVDVEGKEIKILSVVLTYLTRCGDILFDLEIKTMAKVWKGFVFLVESNLNLVKDEYCIEETLDSLCARIQTAIKQILLLKSQSKDFLKFVKLSSFLLKILIKLCQIFSGFFKNCFTLLLTVVLHLIKCTILFGDEDVISQLTIGTDPLVSQLMPHVEFVISFEKMSKSLSSMENLHSEFSLLCCLVCQKLVHCPANVRTLWFNKKSNVLEWMFQSLAHCHLYNLGNVASTYFYISRKQNKFNDMYEYFLVTVSAYLMTVSHTNFIFVENILIKNVLQSNPIKALFAIDIWCLLARYGDSTLCFSQTRQLSNIFVKMKSGSLQMEKLYLRSLIQRLYLLLTDNQRRLIDKEVADSFQGDLWAADGTLAEVNDFSLSQTWSFASSLLATIRPRQLSRSLEDSICINSRDDKLIRKIVNLWKFDIKSLMNCYQSIKYVKVLSVITAFVIPQASPQHLRLVLSQVRKMVGMESEQNLVYVTWILNSLSTVRVPVDFFQQSIFELVAEIFRRMLSSKDILVKLKTLETFYCFSHVTTHSNIITLTVHNSPSLKAEISNYFKKNLSGKWSFSVDEFMQKLCRIKYEHNWCSRRRPRRCPSGSAVELLFRWKEDGETLIKIVNELKECEKNEVVAMCTRIHSLLQ